MIIEREPITSETRTRLKLLFFTLPSNQYPIIISIILPRLTFCFSSTGCTSRFSTQFSTSLERAVRSSTTSKRISWLMLRRPSGSTRNSTNSCSLWRPTKRLTTTKKCSQIMTQFFAAANRYTQLLGC